MTSDAAAGLAGFGVVITLLGLLVLVLWIILPFAVFGLKGLIRQAIEQQRRTNELLEQWARERNGRP